MPVWHEKTKKLRASGKLTVLGITQEQHPDRCLLFARWKKFDWPILWDPFNVTGTQVVPRATLIDEHGVVRSLRADPNSLESDFLAKDFPAPELDEKLPKGSGEELIEALLTKKGTPKAAYYDALSALLWNSGNGDTAMKALEGYARRASRDAAAQWRLGVAYRMRYDSAERHEGDFQAALDQWGKGLALNPSQYIYRRRIQQYGPRLDKPYPFYPWIAEATKALEGRGQEVPALRAPLSGAERTSAGRIDAAKGEEEPDPSGAIAAQKGLLELEASVAWSTPGRRSRGDGARVHLVLRPTGNRVLLWDAEAGPVTVWLELPKGWTTENRLLEYELQGTDKAEEQVVLDFEVAFPGGKAATGTIRGYALYYACLDGPGECRYLRHDFEVVVPKRP